MAAGTPGTASAASPAGAPESKITSATWWSLRPDGAREGSYSA